MPPAEFAAEGVYCTGNDCHKIQPKWERDKREVMPPKSSVTAVWTVEGFGAGKGSIGGMAPIHFAATPAAAENSEMEEKLAPKSPAKTIVKKKSAKAVAVAGGSRKARRKLCPSLADQRPTERRPPADRKPTPARSPFSKPSNKPCSRKWNAIPRWWSSEKMLVFTGAPSRPAKAFSSA